MTSSESREELTPEMFSPRFKVAMIRAYPVISGMDPTFLDWHATPAEKDEAFARILASQNLRRTCELDIERRAAAARTTR